MQTRERTTERTDRRPTGWLIAAATFLVVIIVVGVAALGLLRPDEGDVVATTVAPTPTTTPTTAPPALELEGTYAGNVRYWQDEQSDLTGDGVIAEHIEIPSIVWLDLSIGETGATGDLVIAEGIRLDLDGSFRMGPNNARIDGPENLTRFRGVEVTGAGDQLTITWDRTSGSVEATDTPCTYAEIALTFDVESDGDILTLSDGSIAYDQQCEGNELVRPGPIALSRGSLTKDASPMPSSR